jgi:hypothetical protein
MLNPEKCILIFWFRVFNGTIVAFSKQHVCCKFHVDNERKCMLIEFFGYYKSCVDKNGNTCFPIANQCSSMFAYSFMDFLIKKNHAFEGSNMFASCLRG